MMLSDNLPERVLARVKCLVDNQDGFKIAQQDFELRGYGELTGTRQTGIGELDDVEIMQETELLLQAKEAANGLIDDDPDLGHKENVPLRTTSLLQYW